MSGGIVAYKDYVAGWLDSSIHDFIEVLPPVAASIKYALITCLDSNPNPASLRGTSPELRPIESKLEAIGTGLLLPTKALIETAPSARILFGFDEIWFFASKSIQSKPPTGLVVGPGRLSHARLEKAARWMKNNDCALALGGGEGLNFVVRAHGLVRFLLGYSIEQPESALLPA